MLMRAMPILAGRLTGVRKSLGDAWRSTGALVLAVGIAVTPLAPEAPQAATSARIGFLWTSSATGVASYRSAFTRGLREIGYTEGRNITVEHRYADEHLERLSGLAAEIVDLRVDIIV